jgi:3',5'-cyclic AMP phosphodiesterase CpdA
MRTAVVSDLHLGSRMRMDLLRRPGIRARLVAALRDVDELVLLGDAFELRDSTLRDAVAQAQPCLEELGDALRGRTVVIVPGNHDHRLAWEALGLARPRRRRGLGLCALAPPPRRGPLAGIRAALGTEVRVAYPGYWVRDGIWATHGHYLDTCSAAPTLENVASAVLRPVRAPVRHARRPGDFEAALWPTYGVFHAIAQRRALRPLADRGKLTVRAAERAAERGHRIALGAPRSGTGPGELRRPGVRPLARVLELLRVDAEHVLFGHTHRTGPVEGDDMRAWVTAAGTALHNTGSWVYEPAYVAGCDAGSPYWPGTVTLVEEGRPPRRLRLLAEPQDAHQPGEEADG